MLHFCGIEPLVTFFFTRIHPKMIQPPELKLNLPIKLANGVISNTSKVWEVLVASHEGNVEAIQNLVATCPELIYAQYNYTPPIYFAVREGHLELVKYLLEQGAHDPNYKIYPFQESLQTIARDRGYTEIAGLLDTYASDPSLQKYRGDNGEILYNRTDLQKEFEQAVDAANLEKTESILKIHPEFATDNTFFWSEGILNFAAKENNRKMIDLLMAYGAKVPEVLKWAQFYYFEHPDGAAYLLEKGMSPNTMSWHQVTILHDMAQKGNLSKAALLVKHGAEINPVDDEYQSTPLGLAVKWGNVDMVKYLLEQGADPNKAGAPWATPLAWARKKGHVEIEAILLKAGAE